MRPHPVASGLLGLALASSAACVGPSKPNPATTPDSGTAPLCQPATDIRFRKITLHREFTCEGAGFGDFNRDGVTDVVAGPDWYAGPGYIERHAIWPRMPFDPKGYSDCFFQFSRDFDGDGWLDVLVVGFPGTGAAWYGNPGTETGAWARHDVVPAVDGESPAFTDITGDGVPELVFMSGGRLGWAGPGAADATTSWTFHPLSDDRGFVTFTHGLGTGDLNGDGRTDVMEATGTFLQPPSLVGDPPWARQDQPFGIGGAQIFSEDLDGDGDADVVTTLSAHGYGLAWYEQASPGVTPRFAEHVIVANAPPAAGAAVILHEPHALAVSDVDGDGLLDIVTGERFWGHVPQGDPDFTAPARLYWFRRTTGTSPPCFAPSLIDGDSGVGTQLTTGDLNADGRLDIVISNKKGAFVFLQIGP